MGILVGENEKKVLRGDLFVVNKNVTEKNYFVLNYCYQLVVLGRVVCEV